MVTVTEGWLLALVDGGYPSFTYWRRPRSSYYISGEPAVPVRPRYSRAAGRAQRYY